MKDFDVENTMNETENTVHEAQEDTVHAVNAAENTFREAEQTVENTADDVEEILRKAQDQQNAQNVQNAQTTERSDAIRQTQNAWSAPQMQNPQPQNPQSATYSPYPNGTYRPAQNVHPGPQPGAYTPNPQNANSQSSYTSGAYRMNNAYAAQNSYNPQNRSYNAYGAAYNPQSAQTASVAYAPAKKQKKKSSGSTKAVAVICACAVVLSGLAGFGGTLLGNRIAASNGTKITAQDNSASEQKNTASATGGDSVVIYKSVDNVATSTAASAGGDLTYAQVAALVKDSVVEITTEMAVTNPYFPQFIQQASGAGSGVIISEDGYLITNAHVILNESTGDPAETITVRLTDAEEYPAEVITYDADEDIAILKIDANGLTPARCGDSDKLVVGEELVVIGNPLGELGGTVTNGIVSATQREITVGGVTMSLIQTNAAVNPGNSGGGMFNMKGELVGIVNCKSGGDEIEGLGFAIPIDQALKVSEELLTKGYVSGKPMLGIGLDTVSSNSFFSFYSVRSGLYITSVEEGMNDKVFEVGDRIIAVDGEEVSSREDVKTVIYRHAVGDKITVQLYRNNRLMEVEATLFERMPDAEQNGSFGATDVQGSLNDFFGGNN